MFKKKVHVFLCLSVFFSLSVLSQELKDRNSKFPLPDIPGYITLKGDFHMHTVFSDGHVWPTLRVKEAQRDGLDVISITEHIDYQGYSEDIDYNRERGFVIAENMAKNTQVIVIRGVEISPRVPPYHNNAIFLKDVDAFPYDYMKKSKGEFVMKQEILKEELMAPFLEAQKQGGFVFYNHPHYGWWDKNGDDLFTEFHKDLLSKKILGGIEIVNGQRYNIDAHHMAEKYNLTMIANSDAHGGIGASNQHSHRSMTLVFAKAKTEAAIKDAIENRRTMIYFKDHIIGRKREADPFFKGALDIETKKSVRRNAPQLEVVITNNYDVPYQVVISSDYRFDNLPGGQLTIKSNGKTSFILTPVWDYPEQLTLKMKVMNVLISPEESLETELVINVK